MKNLIIRYDENHDIKEIDIEGEDFKNKTDKEKKERLIEYFKTNETTEITDVDEFFDEILKEKGVDPNQIESEFQAKLQTKAFDYYFALNQILGNILDRAPGVSDKQLLEQIEKIAKQAFEYDKED